jgi:hypothetical protein
MKTTTRHCSFHYPNKTSVICHSAIHRSAFRLSADATQTVFPKNGNPYQRAFKNCRKAFNAFWYWSKQEQAAIDSWIEAIEVDASLKTADRLACVNSRPGWTFTEQTRKGFEAVTATRKDGALQVRLSANSWRELHYLTR